MHRVVLAAALLLMSAAVPAASQERQIRLGTEGAYPPFNFKDETGRLRGFDIDVGDALCREIKARCTWVVQDWDGLIPGLQARKFDAVLDQISITPARQERVDFTIPYAHSSWRFVARKGVVVVPGQLGGHSIGVQRGTVFANWAAKYVRDGRVQTYDTQQNALLDLTSGRIEAYIDTETSLFEWLKANPDYAFVAGDFFDPSDAGPGAGIAVRKGDEALRSTLDAALRSIMANGTYDEINARYFPFSVRPEQTAAR